VRIPLSRKSLQIRVLRHNPTDPDVPGRHSFKPNSRQFPIWLEVQTGGVSAYIRDFRGGTKTPSCRVSAFVVGRAVGFEPGNAALHYGGSEAGESAPWLWDGAAVNLQVIDTDPRSSFGRRSALGMRRNPGTFVAKFARSRSPISATTCRRRCRTNACSAKEAQGCTLPPCRSLLQPSFS
jgi:hypothetical protein